MKNIDYYSFRKKGENDADILEREKTSLNIILSLAEENSKILDAGCYYGRFMEKILKRNPKLDVNGVDLSKARVEEGKNKGLKITEMDLSKKVNIRNEIYDIVYAGEIIEHLYNPDIFVSEINRIIKKGGYFILSTPNLLAWFNRILVLIGEQPIYLEPSTKSKLIGSHLLKSLKNDPQPVGHIRIFTKHALRDILEQNNFEIIKIKGSITQEGFPKFFQVIDKLFLVFPSLSSDLIIIARKK